MIKISVLHFQALEMYPPAFNLLNYLDRTKNGLIDCRVCTTSPGTETARLKFKNIMISRFGSIESKGSVWRRWLTYIYFNAGVLLRLLVFRPDKILYYETYSSFPALVYKLLFPGTKLFIHHHEYFDEGWYVKGMVTVKWFHKLEKNTGYKNANWISHTNKMRLDLFLSDNNLEFDPLRHFVFPNYPPASWNHLTAEKSKSEVIRIVYVGSFGSMKEIYIKECLDWIADQHEKVTLDIYTKNISKEVLDYLSELKSPNIRLNGPVLYNDIPGVMSRFDVGLILYKAVNKNFRFNAPNKLFEYLVCGLDVWYPVEMEGIYEYDCDSSLPKVIRIDFNNLKHYDISKLADKMGREKRSLQYGVEVESENIVRHLLNKP